MLIELDLNINDSESLLRHCAEFLPASGDCREDSRLADALAALAFAIKDSMSTELATEKSTEMIDPQLLESAISLFQHKALAIGWLAKPMRALDGLRPLDVPIEQALALIARLEHGIFA